MILCASPDPKEIHKTISTLEYGAKAKCIVRGPVTPVKEEDSSSAVILGSRIAAMDEFIMKLQMENKVREKERNEAHKKLMKKEDEVAALRAKLELVEDKGSTPSEEEINMKVFERTQILKQKLEKKLEECQRMANEFVELERRRMEERILQQQEEVEVLRKRLEEIELQLSCSNECKDMESSGFVKRLMRVYKSEDDPGMVKSMDLDMDDQEPVVMCKPSQDTSNQPHLSSLNGVADSDVFASKYGDRVCLSTVYEDEEEEGGEKEEDEEVEKEIIEEKRVCSVQNLSRSPKREDDKDCASSRLVRIHNIFTLCGNQRELSQHIGTPIPATKKKCEAFEFKVSPVKSSEKESVFKVSNKENMEPQYVVGN